MTLTTGLNRFANFTKKQMALIQEKENILPNFSKEDTNFFFENEILSSESKTSNFAGEL